MAWGFVAAVVSWVVAAYSMLRMRQGIDPQHLALIQARVREDRMAGRIRRYDLLFAPKQYFTAAGLVHRRRFFITAGIFVALLLLMAAAASSGRLTGR